MNDIELLSPAGSFETARAAFAAGADAVYLGLDAFSARAEAENLSEADLCQLLAIARAQGRRVYVTFNTLIDDSQLPAAAEKLAMLADLCPDGIIVQDLGIARLVRRRFPELRLHASTQLVAHNLEGVLALRELGFTRVVLARELSLADIRTIARRSGVEIEVFVHGALCYSLSGLCLFSAMEKGRSGNRGRCAYCCRLAYSDQSGTRCLPFSMKDLRLDERLEALASAGVASLKIEGRMKSPLYVASVTKRYRDLLDKGRSDVSQADLETVFSRRTTTLYLDGYPVPGKPGEDVIDAESLGHLGTPIGTVKHVTKDREGRAWLRLHTSRALERHDGIQFAAPEGGKPCGFGISEMRTAISRRGTVRVQAGEDVELLLPDGLSVQEGATVFCSASNEVKRRFPVPSFRPSDFAAGTPVDIEVTLGADGLTARTASPDASVRIPLPLSAAQHPDRTFAAVEKAFSRMGTSGWSAGRLAVNDPDRLFAPVSALNELRRSLVSALDAARAERRSERIKMALADWAAPQPDGRKEHPGMQGETLKLRISQAIPAGDWIETICDIGHGGDVPAPDVHVRLALPLFTREGDFAAMRTRVKRLMRAGHLRWEAADVATLRLLRQCGVEDLTADWSLYAFNREAMRLLGELGVSRFTCSAENTRTNLSDISDIAVGDPSLPRPEFLARQCTPLFISLTRPRTTDPTRLTGMRGDVFTAYERDGLWATIRPEPRLFDAPAGWLRRTDISWDA
ncbi:MAG: U32 family peptidase [Kiritimatiellae bacterium]|nr:U32 family peptidase [Kiritimatiellia bacterium]